MRKELKVHDLLMKILFLWIDPTSHNNLEKGLSATIGFDYELTKEDKDFQFSVGQIISDQNNNKISPNTI